MGNLRVGTGKACINPPAELFPIHRYENYYFEEIMDDLYTRAIVLDNGTAKFIFVSLDTGAPPHNEMKHEIADHYGIPYDNLLAFAVHNHTSPVWYNTHGRVPPTPEQEAKMAKMEVVVKQGMYDAIDQAFASLRPARYGFGEGKSYINCNRDKLFEDGSWMQALDPEGFSDKTLAVLKFEDYDGNLIAAVANYACHATVAFCVYDTDGKGKITSGFPGIASKYVENRYDNVPVIIWSSGAAGDQNPLGTSEGYPRIYEKDGYSESIQTPPGTQYMIQRHVGWTHAIDIINTLKTIECVDENMRITTTDTVVELVGQIPPEGADMQYNRLLCDNFLRAYRPELYENGKRPEKNLVKMIPHGIRPVNMQLCILGDVAIIGAAAELFNQLGWHLKEQSPFRKTFVVTHCGTGAGYVMSDESAHHTVFTSFAKISHGNNNKPIIDGMKRMFSTALN